MNLLLKAVAEGSSLEAVCADSCGVVDSNTLREQVNAALASQYELRQQEAEMNAALRPPSPAGMPRGGLEVAIDTHDEPFYGKTPELLSLHLHRTQAKAGTTPLFPHRQRLCHLARGALDLALTYVLPEDDLPGVVECLLQRLGTSGIARHRAVSG